MNDLTNFTTEQLESMLTACEKQLAKYQGKDSYKGCYLCAKHSCSVTSSLDPCAWVAFYQGNEDLTPCEAFVSNALTRFPTLRCNYSFLPSYYSEPEFVAMRLSMLPLWIGELKAELARRKER